MNSKDKNSWQHWGGNGGMSDGQAKRLWEASGSYQQGYQPDMEKGLAAMKQRMGEQPSDWRVVQMGQRRSFLVKIAAGLLVLAIGVIVFKSQLPGSDNIQAVTTTADATLERTLADGTAIELNRSSMLSYKTEFAKTERRVELEGEAFFKVAREEKRPFIIETADAKVTVLGTSFNVRAYPRDGVFEVYVASGKVQVEINQSNQPVVLSKGEFFRYDKVANKAVTGVDPIGIPTAWRTGVLNFKEQPIPVVLEGMERLYGVSIDLKTSQRSGCLQTLTVENGKMKDAVAALKASCPKLKFKEINGGYEVSGTCCE